MWTYNRNLRSGGNTCSNLISLCSYGRRHETGPAAQSRLAYLEHLAASRATLHSLRANAIVIYGSAVCMNLDDTSPVERTAVEQAAKAWANRRYRNTMAEGPEQTEKEFRVVLQLPIKRKTLSQKAISSGAVTPDRRQAPDTKYNCDATTPYQDT